MNNNKGLLSIILAAMIWGGGYVATSSALDSFSPLVMLAFRFLLASGILILIKHEKIFSMTKEELFRSIPLGIFVFLAFFFQTIGVKYTTVSNNSFLTSMNVVMTPYILWFLTKKTPSKKVVFSSILATIGVGILTLKTGFSEVNIGDLYSLVGAMFFSLHVVWSQRCSDIHHTKTTFVQMVVAGMVALILAFLTRESFPEFSSMSLSSLLSIIYLVVMATLIAYMLQMYASRSISPSLISIVLASEALFATIFSVIFLGEKITVRSSVSMILITLAVVLSSNED